MNVEKIFLARDRGLPMESRRSAFAVFGRGLDGDRYAFGEGTWSNTRQKVPRDVSIISTAQLRQGNSRLEVPYEAEQTRRNILVEVGEDDLNSFIGRFFTLGGAWFEGSEPCDPCNRPDKLSGREGFLKAFAGCGGIRARVVGSGLIRVGDELLLI